MLNDHFYYDESSTMRFGEQDAKVWREGCHFRASGQKNSVLISRAAD